MANLSNKEGAYTPGPWIIREAHTNSGTWLEIYVEGEYYCDGSEFCVAQTGTVKSRPHGKRWVRTREAHAIEANARLIAAAPDLLELVKLALCNEESRLYMLPASDDDEVSAQKDILSAAIGRYRAAIAKAEGRS